MVTTIYGEMDESQLKKVEDVIDNDNELTTVTEYWQLVHRSVHVTMKTGTLTGAIAGQIGG